jgi:ABC-type multidrug transport system ATPase subunit
MKGVDSIGSGVEILDRLGYPADASTKVVRALSGGTAQKLNLALAMLGDADILLLDEPYQGFDQGSYLNFWDFAERWRQAGRAVVVVTHLLAELNRVDEVVELRSDRESYESVGEPR